MDIIQLTSVYIIFNVSSFKIHPRPFIEKNYRREEKWTIREVELYELHTKLVGDVTTERMKRGAIYSQTCNHPRGFIVIHDFGARASSQYVDLIHNILFYEGSRQQMEVIFVF